MAQRLLFGNWYLISSHALLGLWLFIHAEMSEVSEPMLVKGVPETHVGGI